MGSYSTNGISNLFFIMATVEGTYGAVGRSSFLLRIGSDMLNRLFCSGPGGME